jgi:hypothetical protein
MRRFVSPVVVAAGFLAAAMAFASAAPAGNLVPFKGNYSGTATLVGGSPPLLALSATGTATHLGKSSELITTTVNFAAACPLTVGTGVLTAANGDKLFLNTSGVACPTAQPGVLTISGTQTVTGGTGRFAGASGSLGVSGTTNTNTGALTYRLEGSITSPGAG